MIAPAPRPSAALPSCGTGTTVVILHPEGEAAILGKCRCEAEAVLAWFQDPAHRCRERFLALWTDFIVPRVRGCRDRCRDIESTYSDSGYVFPVPAPFLALEAGALCRALACEAERRIRAEGGGDGFLEGAGNARLLVDLRGPGALALFLPGHPTLPVRFFKET